MCGSALHAWLVAYVLAMGVAGSGALAKWCGVAYLAALAAVVFDLARDARFAQQLVGAWLAGAAIAAAFSILAIVAFYAFPEAGFQKILLSHYGSLPPGPYPRVRSLFANANMYCNYLVVACALVVAANATGRIGTRTTVLLFVWLTIAALATISPGLGGLALLAGSVFALRMRSRSPRAAKVAFATGLFVAASVFAGMWLNPAAPLREPSVRWRIWQQAWETWLTHPWRGIGLNQDVVGVAFLDPSGNQQWLTDAHNVWLNVGGQAGLPAVLALAGLCGWLCLAGMRAARAGNPLATACLLAFVAAFLYGGLMGPFEDARHLWVLIGLLAASSCRRCSPARDRHVGPHVAST